jgi:hypothetical protein
MQVTITITEQELKQMVHDKLYERLGPGFKPDQVKIETKSTQNYKSEWEIAAFRATYVGDVK